MKGDYIRTLRRRKGLTQNDLANQIGVDQGTVSRWERDAETPRPANLAALKMLLSSGPNDRSQSILDTRLNSNLYSAFWVSEDGFLRRFSEKCKEHYWDRFSLNVKNHVGMHLRQHCRVIGRDDFYAQFEKSNVLDGSILLLRIYQNVRGVAFCTTFEPYFLDDEFSGVIGYLESKFRIQENEEIGIAKVECIYFKNPKKSVILFEGKYAQEMKPPYG